MRDRHGGLRLGALLGAAVSRDGPRGETHAADLRETLCQARQERRGGCGGDLRGDVSAKHAFRRRQERGPTGHADGAQDPRTPDQAAHDERERLAGSSGGVRVIVAKGISHVEELVERAAAADLPAMVQATLGVLLAQLRSLDAAIDELERAIVADHRRDPVSRLAASVPGVGALAASAILASAPDPQAFKSGRDFAAWLGATPKQNSTGGKEKFGSITKQGNRYIRRLLVLGAISVLRAAPKRKGALCDWLAALRARKPPKVVAVALANKLARIVWAIITTGEVFRTSIYAKA